MLRFHDHITETLGSFELSTLEAHPDPIHVLSEDLKLIYFNPAWEEFYKQNGSENELPERIRPGASVLGFIQEDVRHYYEALYHKVLNAQKHFHHVFDCSSPREERTYDQMLYPLRKEKGILLVNGLRFKRALIKDASSSDLIEQSYLQLDGFFHECSNCRRTLRNDGTGSWDKIPAHIENMPPNVSHTICPICFDHFWKAV